MKPEIHPTYYPEARVICASCGTAFPTGSTLPELRIEVCSNCHPFYTGKQNLIDTAGRVDRFQKLLAKKERRQTQRLTTVKRAPAPPGRA